MGEELKLHRTLLSVDKNEIDDLQIMKKKHYISDVSKPSLFSLSMTFSYFENSDI